MREPRDWFGIGSGMPREWFGSLSQKFRSYTDKISVIGSLFWVIGGGERRSRLPVDLWYEIGNLYKKI